MSFMLDAPLLVASGAIITRSVDDPGRRRRLETLTLALFMGGAASLYANAPWARRAGEAAGTESGRDFMINSWMFELEHEQPSAWVHVVSLAALASYPLWLRLGGRLAWRGS